MASSFKNDDSFLRKLAVGAGGTNATMERLRELGFNPIELERGSTGFKIWKKIKIKRVRVPDILCLNSGLRFESRGKTKLEISMSHSMKDPKRAWDSGMRDDDFVSIVVFNQPIEAPLALQQVSPVHFVKVAELRRAFSAKHVTITQPKGVEEGSEIRVLWTCAGANENAVVSALDADRIVLTPLDGGKRQTIQLVRNRTAGKIRLEPLVAIGEHVSASQIVAAVVHLNTSIHCPSAVTEGYFRDRLASVNLSERYAAAKALRYRGYTSSKATLRTRMNDVDEDIYVQLESAAALAAYGNAEGWRFIEDKLRSPVLQVPLETQLETIIVASEIPDHRGETLLIEVLKDESRDDELRAGAAWALGQFASKESANALIDTFNTSPIEVRTEAARALLQIAEPQVPHLIELLRTGEPSKRDGISWVLARTGKFTPKDVILGADDNLRRWMSYIVGFGRDRFSKDDVEAICEEDPQVYFAASVLWQILSSWIDKLTEY